MGNKLRFWLQSEKTKSLLMATKILIMGYNKSIDLPNISIKLRDYHIK